MRFVVLVLFALTALACSRSMPADPTVYVDDEFTSEEHEAIGRAINGWRPALHFRPSHMPHAVLVAHARVEVLENAVLMIKSSTAECPIPRPIAGACGITHPRGDFAVICIGDC